MAINTPLASPPACALKANILDVWRRHYVLEENMLEMECTNLTPRVVLETSGHVNNPTFNDTSFSTQSTQVLAMPAPSAVQGKLQARAEQQRAQFVYIADRFEPYIAQNQTGRYVWLPLRVTASGVRVQWSDEWTY